MAGTTATGGAQLVAFDARRVPLDGAYNFRDIGGYVGAGGRRVRWGKVFRSDHLGGLTDGDLAQVEALGIRTVCDLRRPGERDSAPSRFGDTHGAAVHHLTIGGDAAERSTLTQRMLAGEIRSFTVDEVVDVYARLLEDFPASIGAAVAFAADADRLPLLVHCTAGKDRTGLVIAAILEVLGVDDEAIAADYELTDDYHFEGRIKHLLPELEAAGVRYEDVAPFLSAQRAVLLGAVQHVRTRWGSFDGYLVQHAGLAPEALERLRANLLEPPGAEAAR